LEPEYTLVGGILRWEVMANVLRERLGQHVNVPEADMPQFTAALGCAILGHLRLRKLFVQSAESIAQRAVRIV
jgi:activator of 2-hydroxyglutaryl-CoA dehydratase